MVFGKGKAKISQSPSSSQERQHHIVITQIPGDVNPEARPCIHVQVKLDTVVVDNNIPIYDPSEDDERLSCTWYLDDFLNDHNFMTRDAYGKAFLKAQLAAEKIESYGINLHSQLRGVLFLQWPVIEIDVREGEQPASDSSFSIFDLRWEQLEAGELWTHTPNPTVIVKRIISPSHGQTVSHTPEIMTSLSEPARVEEVTSVKKNILLVIARDLEDPPKNQRREISPAFAQCVITEKKEISRNQEEVVQFIFDLEVVRPGSFKALKEHLALKPPGYFHLVHFDAHGIIKSVEETPGSPVSKAHLQLSHDEFRRFDLQDVPAADVARALREKGVRRVVLNACNSARARLGQEANLGRIFARERLFITLAMSYNIWCTAVPILCSGFYTHLFEHPSTFSEAATHARRALRGQPSRREYPPAGVQDWIVPVTYSNDDDESLLDTSPKTSTPTAFQRFLSPLSSFRVKSTHSSASLSTTRSFTSLRSSRSSTARPLSIFDTNNFLMMDNDILRMEKMLLTTGMLFLHGSETPERRRLLNYLADSWTTTNFLSKVYRVKGTSSESVERAREIFRERRTLPSPSSSTSRQPDTPKFAIIVESVDLLYGPSPGGPETARCQVVLSRFLEDLSMRFYQSESAKSAPYLIIVGVDRLRMLRHFQERYKYIGGPSHMYKGPCDIYHINTS